MVHHFWPHAGPFAEWAHVGHLGWIGVDLFFVISGALIGGILLDTRTEPRYFVNFWSRRVLRIFPLYFLFLAAVFTVIPAVQGGPWSQTEFVRESGSPLWNVFDAGNLLEAITGRETAYFLAITWSLAIEEQFYLVFPFIVAVLSPTKLRAVLWGAVLFAPAFRLLTMLWWPENERVQYLATPSRVDVLALGVLIALWSRGHVRLTGLRTTRYLLPLTLGVLTVAFVLGGLDRTQPFCRVFGYSLVGVAAFTFVLWTAQRRGAASTGWLRLTPLCGLGVLCYGTYLLQRPAEILLGKVVGKLGLPLDLESGTGLLLKCAAAIAAGAASWFLIERPFLSFKRYFVSPRHPAADLQGKDEEVRREAIAVPTPRPFGSDSRHEPAVVPVTSAVE
jgi:peptidoglycan/LPS O-acetylase OafA/YrhL